MVAQLRRKEEKRKRRKEEREGKADLIFNLELDVALSCLRDEDLRSPADVVKDDRLVGPLFLVIETRQVDDLHLFCDGTLSTLSRSCGRATQRDATHAERARASERKEETG